MISLVDVTKVYGTGPSAFHALSGVSLSLGDKGLVVILGPSGCGKTTLLNILGGLDRISAGEFYFDGKDVGAFSPKRLDAYRNKKVGFVFQDYNLLSDVDALHNVTLALAIRRTRSKKAEELGLKALDQVGLKSKSKNKPAELSGGERQRVAIARAIATDPKLLLADEPTGALDSKSGDVVMDLLKKVSKSCLVVMVTHNEAIAARYADRVIRLKDGRICSDQGSEVKDSSEVASEGKQGLIGLGFTSSFLLGLRHIKERVLRSLSVATIMTFGIIALGFALSLMNGFGSYVARVNSSAGTAAPITINAFSQSAEGADWSDYNQSEEFPQGSQIFPTYSPRGSFTVKYNNFSEKYFAYLDRLRGEGYLGEYFLDRPEDKAMTVVTEHPRPIAPEPGQDFGWYKTVNVAQYSQMMAGTGGASYEVNTVFHPLLENYESSYDVLAGKLPERTDELVMIVDYRNAVSFQTLQALGFYHPSDTQEQVYDPSLQSRVKPIDFDAILNKRYRIYSLGSAYVKASEIPSMYPQDALVDDTTFPYTEPVLDDDGRSRTVTRYVPMTTRENIQRLWNQAPSPEAKSGVDARIVGIIRPKANERRSPMNTGIGFLSDDGSNGLRETIRAFNRESAIQRDFASGFARKNSYRYNPLTQTYQNPGSTASPQMFEELARLFSASAGQGDTASSLSEIQSAFDKYFTGYRSFLGSWFDPRTSKSSIQGGADESERLYRYKAYPALTSFFEDANRLGLDFSDPALNGVSIEDSQALQTYLQQGASEFAAGNPDAYYRRFLALGQLAFARSGVSSIILTPSSLTEAQALIAKLEEFNDTSRYDASIPGGDPLHAKDQSEVVSFSYSVYSFTEDIGQAIAMSNVILQIFALICLIGSGVICASVTNMSVMERTREIGLLRALGSSKKDVGWIFETESFFLGLVGGVMGAFLTYVLSFPINGVIDSYYPSYNMDGIAQMAWWHPLVLVSISVSISMVSALIPSLHAATKDPVRCLKSEG